MHDPLDDLPNIPFELILVATILIALGICAVYFTLPRPTPDAEESCHDSAAADSGFGC